MTESIPAMLHEWHDFYITIATAAAGILGAQFVVMSIGSGFMTQERAKSVRTFLTPTIVHLAGCVLACALVMVPSLDRISFAILLGLGAFVGLLFAAVTAVMLRRNKLVWEDVLWYAGAPTASYLLVVVAAFLFLQQAECGLELLALALALLLVTGIRNAWDMLVFLVAQHGPRE
jgi:hypothetical protein